MPSLLEVATFKFKDKIFSQKKAKQSSLFKMQQFIEVDTCRSVWSMNKPRTKQDDRRKIKCKNLMAIMCEQWTSQQLENKVTKERSN
jgi:hypothetical protein